uniref:Serine/threonine-protein kinase BSK1-like TPR repeats domain-containing protein n=1 Tax=Arundo donax TaxID=35708 RepID=A0A0A9DNU5_ARUDO
MFATFPVSAISQEGHFLELFRSVSLIAKLGKVYLTVISVLHMHWECWNLQISLQSWTGQLSESFVVKRHADNAFESKDFATALECYSRFIDSGALASATILARRCFSYMVAGKLQEALADTKKAEDIAPRWPIGYYLQAMALVGLGREAESHEALKKGTALEAERNSRARTV